MASRSTPAMSSCHCPDDAIQLAIWARELATRWATSASRFPSRPSPAAP